MTGSSVVIVKPSSPGDHCSLQPRCLDMEGTANLPNPISACEGILVDFQRASPSDTNSGACPRTAIALSALPDYRKGMPSFDVVSEVDKQEVDNAINQARKELSTRFDFKGSKAKIELTDPTLIELSAEDSGRLKSLVEIVIAKLAKREIDLRNVERKDPTISPLGHARQEILIKHGLDGDKAKEIVKAIKGLELKVQSQIQDQQIRVTGKKRDDLQSVIQLLRARDFGVGLSFKNFRE
jgi:cyclic-di-GMP-binding protein